MKRYRLGYFQTDVIFSWVDSTCRYYIMTWQDDSWRGSEGDYARRHLWNWNHEEVTEQGHERTLAYDKRSKIKIAWRLHINEPSGGWRWNICNIFHEDWRESSKNNNLEMLQHHAVLFHHCQVMACTRVISRVTCVIMSCHILYGM